MFTMNQLTRAFLGVSWIGFNNRSLEAFLCLTCFVYGLTILYDPMSLPSAVYLIPGLYEVHRMGYEQLFAIPFFIKSALLALAIIGTRLRWKVTRVCRVLGILLGSAIWSTLITVYAFSGLYASLVFSFCITSLLFNVRAMGLALVDIPSGDLQERWVQDRRKLIHINDTT